MYSLGQKKYRKRYGSKSSRGQIPDKVSIEQRPDIVDNKERVGDFESDLIIGKNHKGAVLVPSWAVCGRADMSYGELQYEIIRQSSDTR